MATKPSDIPNLTRQISTLRDQASVLERNMSSSPTALGGEGDPTFLDIKNQQSLQRLQGTIQGLTDKKLKTQWYGTDKKKNTEGEEPSMGLIGKTLDFISRPLYGIVGATKYAVGQGENKSLYKNIADNIAREKKTFGDVLRVSGVPGFVAAPLGFALDIGLDPVNWATMGTAALVPRLAVGAYKGVQTGKGIVRGLSIAAKSGVLQKASTVGRAAGWVAPSLKKTGVYSRLGESAVKSAREFRELSGITIESIIQAKGIVGARNFGYQGGLIDVINNVADAIPGGKKFLENWIMDPIEWVRQARMKDILQESLGSGVDIRGAVNAYDGSRKSVQSFIDEAAQRVGAKIKEAPVGRAIFGTDIDSDLLPISSKDIDIAMGKLAGINLDKKVAQASGEFVEGVDDAFSIAKNSDAFITADPIENALRIANEKIGGETITLNDLTKMVNSGALDETGVKWFDNMMRGVKDFTIKADRNSDKVYNVGKQTMNYYDKAMAIFRAAKVGASPTAMMNMAVGNLVMVHMSGSLNSIYMGKLGMSANMYLGRKNGAENIEKAFKAAGRAFHNDEDYILRVLADNQTATRQTFGGLGFMADGHVTNYGVKEVGRHLRDAGHKITNEELAPLLDDVISKITQTKDPIIAKVLPKIKSDLGTLDTRRIIDESVDAGKTGIKGPPITRWDVGTSITGEMFSSTAGVEMLDNLARLAKDNPSNLAYKGLDIMLNKMPSTYQRGDQTYKMATLLYATTTGYSEPELRIIRNLVDINPEEIVRNVVDGVERWVIHPRTALELANVQFMNYQAMPAAIRVLRNFPIVGSPFASFMYGMVLKTGQTLAYNPSAFNKVSFAMQEFGGPKTPLEKKALDQSYYSYLKQSGMMRLPFFKENPIYLNMTNMIPYYSLNMFNPSQTKYEGGTWRESIAQTVQQSPILKDPAGSVIFDYLIQPLILGEAIQPQGQFGQPLYPVDAGFFKKTAYGARTFTEAFVPGIASYAGLLTPEAAAEFIPSYRWRELARAKAGKGQLGISRKEGKMSSTIRSLLKTTGIPVQAPVRTEFTQE